jgi:hypothetical protein
VRLAERAGEGVWPVGEGFFHLLAFFDLSSFPSNISTQQMRRRSLKNTDPCDVLAVRRKAA